LPGDAVAVVLIMGVLVGVACRELGTAEVG
jgi:hypothetical protein